LQAVAHAFEMAVLSSVQHPNIVQAYSCLTDMIDVDARERSGATSHWDTQPDPYSGGDGLLAALEARGRLSR
jgi:hypothetical protein